MNYKEDYVFWRLANYFIAEQGYRIIQLFENQKELWLEKLENNKNPILRLLRQDLDWSNSMQRDIEFTASNGEKIRKQIGRGELSVVNIYISQFPPVDEYEYRLKSPYIFPNGNKTSVSSVLLTRDQYDSGFKVLSTILEREVSFPIHDTYSEQEVVSEKKAALDSAVKKEKSERAAFANGRPFFTYAFMIIQIAIFLFLEIQGGSTNNTTLIKYGAKYNFYIYDGEWWRFITPIFLHIGLMHLAMNTFSLYYLGTAIEKMYGSFRYLVIYLFAGVTGVIASFLFSQSVSAGASGAIYGCFGALLYFGITYPKLFSRTMGASVIGILVINLIISFTIPGIDEAGHLGGLAGGFLAAGIVQFPKKKKPYLQTLFFVMSCAIVWGSLTYAFSDKVKARDESYILVVQDYVYNENYDEAYNVLKRVEKITKNPPAQFYFSLSIVETRKGMLNDGKGHLQKAIQLEPNFPDAYYYLALICLEEGDLEQAKMNAEKAVELMPEQREYSELVQEINRLLPSFDGGE
ncbi:rhomboid family intramembrane serine protease [Neobacillus sp. CF12]|uniref:rhomboid family intramembrane serine protease n=1 Tax=Neobacillus sp. CF12 TaxID=3055864 RepID=UPI00259FE2DD|nr:rhomboid family intramembrane serine protease [Neobacillus sp. CF12]MDM5331019.1 rhomboid family intramembrane serine protease [Neobacillus sp. CF12]